MKMQKVLLTFTSFLLLASNSFGAEFEFKTTPTEAEVFVYGEEGDVPQKVGNSPLKMDTSQFFSFTKSETFFTMEIRKEGYETVKFIMMKTGAADFKMDLKLEVSREIRTIKKHDKLIAELFDIQKLIRSNNYGEALAKLELLEKDFPNFSIIPELKGISYYMSKDIEKALSQFRAAFSKNSENRDAFKMKVYLEKKLGIDTEIK